MERQAGCSCGELRVTVRSDPARVSVCHCLECQRRTGSAYGLAAFFRREHVATEGRSTSYRRSADSGRWVNFHFCPTCGSTVFWESEQRPELIAVAVGAFADPSFPPPHQSVFDKTRHRWVAPLDPAAPS